LPNGEKKRKLYREILREAGFAEYQKAKRNTSYLPKNEPNLPALRESPGKKRKLKAKAFRSGTKVPAHRPAKVLPKQYLHSHPYKGGISKTLWLFDQNKASFKSLLWIVPPLKPPT
jgi:hypothetical protein